MKILLVEDDRDLASAVRTTLEEHHYVVDVAHDGERGEDLALSNDYDVVLLDVMLPGRDGHAVCRAIRVEGNDVPILLLTALGEAEDTIAGLDAGADDYLPKPFHTGVLLARIRSLGRRRSEQKTTTLRAANLVLDTVARTVTRAGQPIRLTPREFAMLEYFLMNSGRTLGRDRISEHVWEMNFDPRSNVVDSLVRILRQKIDHGFDPPLIHTVRGAGYRFGEEG